MRPELNIRAAAVTCLHHTHLRRGVIHCCRCGLEYLYGFGWAEPSQLARGIREKSNCTGVIK